MAPLQHPFFSYTERSANEHSLSRTPLPQSQQPIPAKTPQPLGFVDVVANHGQASPSPYASRAAGQSASRHARGLTQSAFLSSKSEHQTFLSQDDRSFMDRPDVIITSFSDDGHQHQPCEGHPCLFYGEKPLKYPQCQSCCTEHGVDGAHYIRRHLEKHHREDVTPELLRAVLSRLTVKDVMNKNLDNRRNQPGEKILPKDKLAMMYKRARKVLLGIEESKSIPPCPLRQGHVRRRGRFSNRTSEAMSEKGSQYKRQRPNPMTVSQASSVTNLESSSNVGGGSTRTESHLSLDDGDANHKEMHMHRIEAIKNRLVGFSNFTGRNKHLDASLLNAFERIEAILNQWEKRSHNPRPQQTDLAAELSMSNEETMIISKPTQVGTGLNRTYDSESHLYHGGGQSLHNPPHDMDLEMIMGARDPATLLNPASSVLSSSGPYVPSQQTWQEQIFAHQDLPTYRSMEINRVSHTPEPAADPTYPKKALQTSSLPISRTVSQAPPPPTSSLASQRRPSSRLGTHGYSPQAHARSRVHGHEPARYHPWFQQLQPQQQYSSNQCPICGLDLAVCSCNDM